MIVLRRYESAGPPEIRGPGLRRLAALPVNSLTSFPSYSHRESARCRCHSESEAHSKGMATLAVLCHFSTGCHASDPVEAIIHQQGRWLPWRLCWLNTWSVIGSDAGSPAGPLPWSSAAVTHAGVNSFTSFLSYLHRESAGCRCHPGSGCTARGMAALAVTCLPYRLPVIGIRQSLTSKAHGCPAGSAG